MRFLVQLSPRPALDTEPAAASFAISGAEVGEDGLRPCHTVPPEFVAAGLNPVAALAASSPYVLS